MGIFFSVVQNMAEPTLFDILFDAIRDAFEEKERKKTLLSP